MKKPQGIFKPMVNCPKDGLVTANRDGCCPLCAADAGYRLWQSQKIYDKTPTNLPRTGRPL
jgi:hypothetical protein